MADKKLTPDEQRELDALNKSGLTPDEQQELDALNGVKKKDIPSWTEQLRAGLDGVGPEFSNDPIVKKIRSSAAAPTVEQKLVYTQPSGSDKDLQFYSKWKSKFGTPVPDEVVKPLDPKELKAQGLRDDEIQMLLAEERRAIKQDPDFYKRIAEDNGEQDGRPDDTMDMYKVWARENGQSERLRYLVEKAHSEIPKDTPEQLRAYEQRVIGAGPEFVPVDTPTGLQIWEEARNVKAGMLNKAYSSATKNPDVAQKLERLNDISTTLMGSKPQSDDEIKDYNDLVQEHTGLRNDPDVKQVIEISKEFDKLKSSELELYKRFPEAYKKRAEELDRQKAVDLLFESGAIGAQTGLPASVYGPVSMIGRALTDFGGSVLKAPAMFDADNSYGPSDRWRDAVDKVVDGINEDMFQIPSWYDGQKAADMRAGIDAEYTKKIEEAPEDQKEVVKQQLDRELEKIGTGSWTYVDDSGNRVFRNDLILPKFARVVADMGMLLLGGAATKSGLEAFKVGSKASQGMGLFASSYVQTEDEYRKAGLQAGLTPEQAAAFSHGSAALTSALELISPNKYLWSKSELAERVAKGVASGMGAKQATKEAFKFWGKEVLGENAQELSQMIGDKAVEAVANKSIGRDAFQFDSEKIKDEAFETVLMTTLVAGLPSGAHGIASVSDRNQLYSDAVKLVAENKAKYMPMLKLELKKSGASPEYAKQVIDDVNSVPETSGTVYRIDGKDVEADAMKAHIEAGGTNNLYIANDSAMEEFVQEINGQRGGFKPKPTGATFFSPSERESSSFEDAQQGLRSPEHKQLGKLSKQLASELGLSHTLHPAIGDWSDGAEESFYEEVLDPSRDEKKVEYMAAVRGLAANQKAVIPFVADKKGNDVVHSIEVPDKLENVRAALNESGIQFRTLVPVKGGTKVVVFDMGNENAPAVKQFADKYNVVPRSIKGTGTFLGGETRDAGRQAMEEVVSRYEGQNPERAGLASRFITDYRNNIAGAAKEEVKPEGETKAAAEGAIEGVVEGVDLNHAERIAKSPELKRTYKVLRNVKKALSKIAPETKIVFYKDDKAGNRLLKSLGEGGAQMQANGFYHPESNTLAINLETHQSNTAFHEGIHPIVNMLQDRRSDLFEKFALEASATPHPEGGTYGDYMGDPEEALVELLADYADGKFDENQGVVKRIENFIREILNAIGIGSQAEDLKAFAKEISDAIAFGKAIDGKSVGKKGAQFQAERLFTGDESAPVFKSVSDITKWLQKWAKKNKVFAKDVSKLSDEQFVKGIVDHTIKELEAWDKVRGDKYLGFYDHDIPQKLNPALQKFAEKRYGRKLSDAEIGLYHILSGFASPSADPMFDSSKGLEVFDNYMRTGKISAYGNEQATIWETNDKGQRYDTGRPRFDENGNPVYKQVAKAYAVDSLDKFQTVVDKLGSLDKAIQWMESVHSYAEASEMMGTPLKGPKALPTHENFTKDRGGFGIFAFTGAKLGSYVLNRVGEYSTVTKDMWYARTMARLTGEPLTNEKGEALKLPWALTVEGVRKRRLADKAWEQVGNKLGITPADVQQRMWDFEKRLYEKLGSVEKESYASEGLIKKAKELEPSVQLQDRKLNQTAKRVAEDAFTDLVRLKADVIANPDQYSYDPQSIVDKEGELRNMTLDEVVKDQTIDKLLSSLGNGNEFAVLSAIELLQRYNAQGLDTRPIFKKLREAGTSIGQLLRQFAQLKTTGEGMANVVIKNIQSMNLELTDDQVKKLYDLTKKFEISRDKRNGARIAFINDSSDANKQALDNAFDEMSDDLRDLTVYVGQITPMGIDKMLTTMLQGNLLVPKSLIANVVGNVVNVAKYPEKLAGSLGAYAYNRLWRRNPVSAVEMFWGSGLNSTSTFFGSWLPAVKNAVTSRMGNELEAFEVKRNLQPFNSWWQMVTTEGRKTLPVRGGAVPFSVWAEKALEASPMAMNAELMFRALYVGDQPFRNSAKLSSQWAVYAELGGKAKFGSFDRFLNQISIEDAKRIERMTAESTFSEDGELYQMIQPLINVMSRNADTIASGSPVLKSELSALLKVMGKTTVPYVKVPANLIQRAFEYSMPVIPYLRSLTLAARGDHRRSAEMFGRAVVGYSLNALISGMYGAGVIIAGTSGDDDSERNLKYEEKPNGINIDAFKRYINGTQDPQNPKQKGDRVWDFTKFGIVGIVAAIRANTAQDEQRKMIDNPFDKFTHDINSAIQGSLEMSFLQGALNTSEEFSRNGITGVATEMLASGSAIFVPNNFMVYTKSQAPYILRAKDEDALTQLKEKMSVKLFPTIENNVTGVYPIISMFGDPVPQTPSGHNPVLYNFFNITNGREVNDPMIVDILNLYSRYKSDKPAITAPTPKIKIGDDLDSYVMDQRDYTYAQMLAGRYKRFEINVAKDSGEWDLMSDQERHEFLSTVNENSNNEVKLYLSDLVEKGIENGSISVDKKNGRYHYVNRPAFDFDYYERNKQVFEQ